ncbi:thyroid peroxidase-like [Morone saxatilis]|uniref:thyroid peroxidase-like n=1 Tax=Morone saxatilis TaxID=34816 RepID=UPI0015E23256|nr:thyroid peroxidase-like [Morone saxatilis]
MLHIRLGKLLLLVLCIETTCTRELLISSYQESLQIVHEALLLSRQRRSTPSSSMHVFTFLRQTEPETLEISRAAEVFQTTLQVLKNRARQRHKRAVTTPELLSWEDVELIAELSQCLPATHPAICQHSHLDKYRSITGLCNNRQNPLWGAANTPLVRWLPAEYEDGEREPKGWNRGRLHNGFQLPSMGDITSDAQGCMPFYRSVPACYVSFGSDIGQALQRQQMNAITSFMDASVVYGHTPKLECFLRDLSGLNGKLAVNDQFKDPKGRPYLPFVATLPSTCLQDPQGERVECFSAGDSRVSEGLPLTSLHTLWLREHNRIAEALNCINGHWSPETIYQETRKIIGALHQIITMRDYVPKIIGSESFERYIGSYGGYDPTTDPSASNVFATAAFRFGHATISPILRRLNESFQEHEHFPHLRLHNTFFSPWRIVKEGGIEPILRGIIGTAATAVSADMMLTEELTERLVVLNVPQHLDLAALNLQRGRDHALPGLSCVEFVNDDKHWLEDNFGRFREHASYRDFVTLKNNFNGVEVADLLTFSQLAQLAATPSQLKRMQDVTKIMAVINPVDFGAFFETVSPAIEVNIYIYDTLFLLR